MEKFNFIVIGLIVASVCSLILELIRLFILIPRIGKIEREIRELNEKA